ncbi:HEAT repeat domain-containing protein [Pseudanabaena minima]|uniref:HEAT repeat domain-containing protein n=1 Tax=Pseudanabaena minima TaxID=890415 RepID=UPI003DA86FED
MISAYQQWWRLYTLTDATGRESQRVDREQIAPAFFDFGLMVQTVEPPKSEQEGESERDREKKEKIERLPVLEGICKYAGKHDLGNHVLLVGRPGSGKSTALARLLWDEAGKALKDQQAKIPVLVELRYLPSEANESSVCDRILAFMHKHDPALDIDETGIKQLLSQGRLLLLVDGVNELPSDRGRVMVNQFRELYQKTCPMIFTTRELSAGGDLGIAKRLEMQPLTEPQMQQFVMAYLPTQGERLLRQLSGRLREFGQTPLLLWMLCSLFQQSEQIPENLGEIFRKFTKFYETESIRYYQVAVLKGDVQPLSDQRLWSSALEHLASKMMKGDSPVDFRTVMYRDEIEQTFKERFQDEPYPPKFARDCLDDLIKYHLLQVAFGEYIEFRHQLIQEYYAAEWLLGLLPSLSDARLQQVYLNYLKWTEPLALMLALVEDEEQAVRVVRVALEVDLRLGARLAGAVKYEFQEKTIGLLAKELEKREIHKLALIEILGETKSDFAVATLVQTLQDSDYHVHEIATEVLGNIGTDRAIKALISDLKNSDVYMRCQSAEVLTKIANDTVNDKAISVLILSLNDSDYDVRWKAEKTLFSALSNITVSAKSIESLIKVLKHPDSSLQKKALEALARIDSDRVFKLLLKVLKDSDYELREKAAELLFNSKDVRAVSTLLKVLKDSDYELREKAAEALGNIGCDKSVDALIVALRDSDYNVRGKAANALVNIGSDKVVKSLLTALFDPDTSVYQIVSYILGAIGGETVIDSLTLALKAPEIRVRQKAINVLSKIDDKKSVEALIFALNDLDYNARQEVAEALGKIGSKKAIDALISALNDSDSSVRQKIAKVLGKVGNDKAVDALISCLNIETLITSLDYESLSKSASNKIVDLLIPSLNATYIYEQRIDKKTIKSCLRKIFMPASYLHPTVIVQYPNYHLREIVADALGNIGSDKAVAPLIQTLNDAIQDLNDSRYASQAEDVCISSEKALGKIGSHQAVDTLIQAIKHPNRFVSRHATKALGKIGSKRAVEPLIQALENPYSYYQELEAAEALGNIGSDKAVEPLIQALNHSDYDVRSNAAEALGKIGGIRAVEALLSVFNYLEKAEEALFNNEKNQETLFNNINVIVNEKAIDSLIAIINDSKYCYSIRERSLQVLGKTANSKAIDILFFVLQNSDYYGSEKAAEAFFSSVDNINTTKVVDALISTINASDHSVREKSLETLVNIGSNKAVDVLIQAFKDLDVHGRESVVEALGKIGSFKAVNFLVSILQDSDFVVRREAEQALVNIGTSKSIDALLQTFKDLGDNARERVAEAIGKIGGSKAVDVLMAAIKSDSEDNVRDKAAESLGKIGSDKELEDLILDLESFYDYARNRAARALIRIAGSDRNLPILTQQLPHLLTLIPTESSQEALSVITAIQARCKYYNYDIAQTPLPPEDNPNPTTGNTYIFNDKVGQVVSGNLIVQGDNIATQNNQKTAPES